MDLNHTSGASAHAVPVRNHPSRSTPRMSMLLLAMMLALGRFVFMPYQRAQIEKAGLPTQNGDTHFAAGDVKAEEASFLNTTNDPAGFTLIDVMAWGSLGHALGFAALAVGSFSLL